MKVTLNGTATDVSDGATLAALLENNGVAADTRGVAVAVNDTVVPRAKWAETPVADGDTIEVIHAVQGG